MKIGEVDWTERFLIAGVVLLAAGTGGVALLGVLADFLREAFRL